MRITVVTRILLSIHLLGIAILIFNLWMTNYQLTSPLIPQSLRTFAEKPIIICLVASSIAFIISASAHYFSKNIVSICVSALAIVYVWILDPLFTPAT